MNKYHVNIRYIVTKVDEEGALKVGDRILFYSNGGIEIGYRLGRGTYIFSKDAERILKTAEFEIDKEWIDEKIAFHRTEIKRIEEAINDCKKAD